MTKAGIATIVPEYGVGIAFRGADKHFKERLNTHLNLRRISPMGTESTDNYLELG